MNERVLLGGNMNTSMVEQLQKTRLFAGIADGLLAEWIHRSSEIFLQPGECLLTPGLHNDKLYVLLEGTLAVAVTHKNSEPLATIEPGHCVGELSCLDGGEVTSYVVALKHARLLCLASGVTHAFVRESHTFCLNLLYLQASRFRQSLLALRNSRKTEAMYRMKAETDELTGLFNRSWFSRMIAAQLLLSESTGKPVCLAMIDLDHFKSINDTYGHLAGDAVLKFVGSFLRAHLRQSDAVARYGGEEFVVMMPGPKLHVAVSVLDQLRAVFSEQHIALPDGDSLIVTLSAGVTEYQLGDTLEDLIGRADQMLYQAKHEGRNAVRPLAPSAKGSRQHAVL